MHKVCAMCATVFWHWWCGSGVSLGASLQPGGFWGWGTPAADPWGPVLGCGWLGWQGEQRAEHRRAARGLHPAVVVPALCTRAGVLWHKRRLRR